MASDWILNCGIMTNRPLEIDDEVLIKFAGALMTAFPMMTETERDVKEGKFTLYEQGRNTRTREVMISKKHGVQVAASADLSPEEQSAFAFATIDLAEGLGISKLNVNAVDLRLVFKTRHWGNHQELVVKTVLGGSPLLSLIEGTQAPVMDLDLGTVLMLDRDVRLALLFNTNTSVKEIRSGDYDGDSLALICGIARTGGFVRFNTFGEIVRELGKTWDGPLREEILNKLVKPIRMCAVGERTIALQRG